MSQPEAVAFRQLFDSHFGYVWSVLRRLGVGNRTPKTERTMSS